MGINIDTRLAQESFDKTINNIKIKYNDEINLINEKIRKAESNLEFTVKITNDDIPNLNNVGKYIKKYFIANGYNVSFNIFKDDEPYIMIGWFIRWEKYTF